HDRSTKAGNVLHRRISRSPGATVFHADGADHGQTPAADCRVFAANGSGRILWTRRSNKGGPASCPLDDPSFAAAVSTCSSTRKGATASLIHRPRSWNGAKGHPPAPVLSGRGLPGGIAPEVSLIAEGIHIGHQHQHRLDAILYDLPDENPLKAGFRVI
ncbi:hypothetical protein, partial [Gluconobacter thailandicus]|uniref:hypothetical protein n=1 Tax=Gluconobacter thailandicus TaxID=257438 RepID=UPI0005598F5E